MKTTSLKINNETVIVYLMIYDEFYIISIPDLAFSMKVSQEESEEVLFEEIVMHLFTFMNEDESEAAALNISQAVREL